MYLFWHFIIALSVGLLLYRPRNLRPHGICVAIVVMAGGLPDLDHLLAWDPKYLQRILPWRLWEGLAFAFRSPVTSTILHMWVWPLLLLAGGLIGRKKQIGNFLLAAAMGWALHLVLDGVVAAI